MTIDPEIKERWERRFSEFDIAMRINDVIRRKKLRNSSNEFEGEVTTSFFVGLPVIAVETIVDGGRFQRFIVEVREVKS